jgi:hypothetical protein
MPDRQSADSIPMHGCLKSRAGEGIRTQSVAVGVAHKNTRVPELRFLERAKGFEPSTPTLARLCSTPELRPLGGRYLMIPDR